MIEIIMTYDFQPGANQQAYADFAKKAIGVFLKASGFVEFRGSRNMLGTPQMRATTVWQTLGDWAKFRESAAYQGVQTELLTFITNIQTEIWGPSSVVPEPIRPSR